MAKRKQKASASAASLQMPIQFRPNAELGHAINRFATTWKTNRNDAARRLCCLAAFGFSERHHEIVETYSGRQIGGDDFVSATIRLFCELQAVDTTRCNLGKPPMGWEEREAAIVNIAKNYRLLHRNPEVPAEEQPRAYIYEHY